MPPMSKAMSTPTAARLTPWVQMFRVGTCLVRVMEAATLEDPVGEIAVKMGDGTASVMADELAQMLDGLTLAFDRPGVFNLAALNNKGTVLSRLALRVSQFTAGNTADDSAGARDQVGKDILELTMKHQEKMMQMVKDSSAALTGAYASVLSNLNSTVTMLSTQLRETHAERWQIDKARASAEANAELNAGRALHAMDEAEDAKKEKLQAKDFVMMGLDKVLEKNNLPSFEQIKAKLESSTEEELADFMRGAAGVGGAPDATPEAPAADAPPVQEEVFTP